jgi:hypothetical protein
MHPVPLYMNFNQVPPSRNNSLVTYKPSFGCEDGKAVPAQRFRPRYLGTLGSINNAIQATANRLVMELCSHRKQSPRTHRHVMLLAHAFCGEYG